MPRRVPPGEKPKDHRRTLRKRQVTLTADLDDVVAGLARQLAQPGLEPNFSEAARKIIAEWRAGTRAKADLGPPIKRGRKKT